MTTITKLHDHEQADLWSFSVQQQEEHVYTGYELALCWDDGQYTNRCMGHEPPEDAVSFWSVYGLREDFNSCKEAGFNSDGPTEHIMDFDNIHSALGFLVKLGIITKAQKHEVERKWMA